MSAIEHVVLSPRNAGVAVLLVYQAEVIDEAELRQVAPAADQRGGVAVLQAAVAVAHGMQHEDVVLEGRLLLAMPKADLRFADFFQVSGEPLAIEIRHPARNRHLMRHTVRFKADQRELAVVARAEHALHFDAQRRLAQLGEAHAARVANVLERIRVEDNEIGALAPGNHPGIDLGDLGGIARRGDDRLGRLAPTRLFGMMDDNLDGKLQKDELKGNMGNMIAPYFARIDFRRDRGRIPASPPSAPSPLRSS